MTKQQFIDLLASKLNNCPVLKSLAIAQACLESAYGTKSFNNNIYGIKCHDPNAYAGCKLAGTKEYIDGSYKDYRLAFQVYHSIDESIADYCRLMNISRYKPVRQATNYIEATQAIKDCGYATSISYVNSLRRIIEQYNLTKYDGDNMTVLDDEGNDLRTMYLTKNFKFNEFFCNGVIPPQEYWQNIKEVATELQKVRDILGKPIIITSGYRSPAYNKKIGGATYSQHLTGKAVDSKMAGVNVNKYLAYLVRYTSFNGFGIANSYIHTDTRPNFTVWVY